MIRFILSLLATCTLAAFVSDNGNKVEIRIKDLARLEGVRSNQLSGIGLVFGLEGTGDRDQTRVTTQALANVMARAGINPDPNLKVRNIAAVMVTAELPVYARAGQKIDVNVASIGDAKSLAGGTLLMTELTANNGDVYAVAQGPILVGGFAAAARGGNAVTKNHPTAGRIPDGAIVERETDNTFADRTNLRYALLEDDFTTVTQVVESINEELGEIVARALDPRTVSVHIPREFQGRAVELAARLENLAIQIQPKSRVVVNEKTGTVIMGNEVRVSAVSIVQGGLSITVSSTPVVSQPESLSQGTTVADDITNLTVTEDAGRSLRVDSGVTVGQLAESLNAIGVTPRDLVAILQAIKDAGALSAELRIL